jgi:DNA mismatch endonuclease (patch repair protein)
MMAGIRGKNTRPEILIRKVLHRAGLRFRMHVGELPGKPDIVLPRWRAVIQVQGCFWHGHDCHLFRLPKTRREFWEAKIAGNRARDAAARAALAEFGWRQLEVWECALKGRTRLSSGVVDTQILVWVRSPSVSAEIRGRHEIAA